MPIEDRLRAAPHLDGVVGDQAMAADDQVERALALADAALAGDQHAEAEDVHQHAWIIVALGEAVLEHRGQLARSRSASATAVLQQRHAARARPRRQLRRRREAAGDQHAGEIVRERGAARTTRPLAASRLSR